ncbi:hypothetical protein [Metabacillus litoralis]|uniref:hypothetical protein n=1 Tax=Metabacillus litoralis TaxID=152268 RepID=UPI001CFDE6CA|nr:hypothetical protein [Metabacillus litoralis]
MISLEVVIYKNELYQVFFTYTSGYMELKKIDSAIDDIILAHRSEISNLGTNAS